MQADQAAVEAMFARMLEDGLDLSRPLRWGFYFVDADRRPLEWVFAKLKEHGYELQDLRALDDGEGWMLHVCKTEVLASDKWKPFTAAGSMRDSLLPAFRRVVDKAVVCRGNSDKAVPFHFSARDLRVTRAYRNRSGRTIVAIELDERRYGCDGPPGDDWATHWFLLGDAPRLLGVGLDLVDAGDYDGDGASELLFWHSGDNEDGYTLFADSFTQRTDRWWSYH